MILDKRVFKGGDGFKGFPPAEVCPVDAGSREELRREPGRGGQEGEEGWQDGLPTQVRRSFYKYRYSLLTLVLTNIKRRPPKRKYLQIQTEPTNTSSYTVISVNKRIPSMVANTPYQWTHLPSQQLQSAYRSV